MSGRQVQVTSSSVGTSVCACEDDGLLAEAMGYPHQLAAGAMKELHRVLDRHIRREVLYRNAKTWIISSEPTSLSRTNRKEHVRCILLIRLRRHAQLNLLNLRRLYDVLHVC